MSEPLLGNEDGELDAEGEEWMRAKGGSYVIGPLLPYLAIRPVVSRYNAPGYQGRNEWPAYCPLHPDAHPSMSINFLKGKWYCFAGCGGGSIEDLLAWPEGWVP